MENDFKEKKNIPGLTKNQSKLLCQYHHHTKSFFKNCLERHLCKMHPYGVYYALQYKYSNNYVFLGIKFGEGNQKKIRGGGARIKIGIIYTPGAR